MTIIEEFRQRVEAEPIMGAWISPDGVFRWVLWRVWDPRAVVLYVVMHNPSTADGRTDDPTIRRVIGFARREGFGGICVVNLFALRATAPKEVYASAHPIGAANDAIIAAIVRSHDNPPIGIEPQNPHVLCAWGTVHKAIGMMRVRKVTEGLTARRCKLFCLGLTEERKHPRHPLYVPKAEPFHRFKPKEAAHA